MIVCCHSVQINFSCFGCQVADLDFDFGNATDGNVFLFVGLVVHASL